MNTNGIIINPINIPANFELANFLKLPIIVFFLYYWSVKKKKKTQSILSTQIKIGLKNVKEKSKIFIAYEPVWAIGTGIVPKSKDLFKTINFIKSKFKDKSPKVLYGGSVNLQNIKNLKEINNIDGFLIGGASQNANKFIDIVKKTYS
jgi:triosephosphate isomerase